MDEDELPIAFLDFESESRRKVAIVGDHNYRGMRFIRVHDGFREWVGWADRLVPITDFAADLLAALDAG